MSKRLINEKRFRAFNAELTALEGDGLLDASTAERIRAMFDVVPADARAWPRLIFLTLSTLALVMLAMAVFLLIGFNWKWLAPCWKTMIVLGSLGATFAAACITRWKDRPILAELLFFAVALLYGAGIWQIAQIFHISSHYPQGLWCWAVGVWILAFAARTPILPIFAAILLAVWAACEVSFTGVGPGLWRDAFPAWPNLAYTLPIFSGIGWLFARKRSMNVAARYYAAAFFFWGVLFPFAWNMDEATFWFWVVWSGLFVLARFFYLRISPLSIELILLAAALLWVSVYELNEDILPNATGWAIALTVLGNLLALTLAFGLMRRRGSDAGKCFALGVFYFIVWALVRYFDLFGDFGGMLGAAAVFAFLAVTLFASGIVWSRIAKKRAETASPSDCAPVDPLAPTASAVSPRYLAGGAVVLTILCAALFQSAVLGEMILSRTVGFRGAAKISVETAPVDPRDLFRGDYVTLNYDFTDIRGERWRFVDGQRKTERLFDASELSNFSSREKSGRTVYTVMEKSDDGVWRPVKMTLKRPESGLFLKGYCDGGRVKYGLDAFYVQAGTGREIEDAIRENTPSAAARREADSEDSPDTDAPSSKRVLVDLLVKPNGSARIENLRVVPRN